MVISNIHDNILGITLFFFSFSAVSLKKRAFFSKNTHTHVYVTENVCPSHIDPIECEQSITCKTKFEETDNWFNYLKSVNRSVPL